jgi:hypothetical protein
MFPRQRPCLPHQRLQPIGEPVAAFCQEGEVVFERDGLRELGFQLPSGAVGCRMQPLDPAFRLMGAWR